MKTILAMLLYGYFRKRILSSVTKMHVSIKKTYMLIKL